MKHLIRTFIVLFALAAVLPACKKDAVDLENSYMEIYSDNDDGNITSVENELSYLVNLSPGTLSGGVVTVTYSSEADPEGFSIEAKYYDTEFEYGRDVYNVQQISYYNFYAAAETNADEKRLKVNPEGDKITITVGDNVLSETIDFDNKYYPTMVANFGQGLSIEVEGQDENESGLGGEIMFYNETGERPDIVVYSESDPTRKTISPNADLYDNGYQASDVETKEDFGRTYYSLALVFEPQNPDIWPNDIIVNSESDIIYVEIDGKTFSVAYEGESIYQTIMSSAK